MSSASDDSVVIRSEKHPTYGCPSDVNKNKLSRPQKKRHINTFSSNFPPKNRSKNVESNTKKFRTPPEAPTITKDKQIETLIQRVVLLHKHNNQFAKENKRLLTMLQKSAEPKQCDMCPKLRFENETVLKNNSLLENDVAMLKTLVFRLNVQIEIYQQKLQHQDVVQPIDISQKGELHDRPPLRQWGPVNSETLGPLFTSYEEMIKEKDDLINQYEKEFISFTTETRKINEENLHLQQELDSVKKSSNEYAETRIRLTAQAELLKSKLDVQTRRADVAKEKLLEVIQCYEQKTQSLSLDLEHIQGAYSRAKSDLLNLKNANANEPNILSESVRQCKQLFEELKMEHASEKSNLVGKCDQLSKENSELKVHNDKIQKEGQVMQEELKSEKKLTEELKAKEKSLQISLEKLRKSRDSLRARLKIAIQWAKKLDQEHSKVESTWDAMKQLEAIVRHKEAQLKGLHSRHLEEMDKLRLKLQQKDNTIRSILQSKVAT